MWIMKLIASDSFSLTDSRSSGTNLKKLLIFYFSFPTLVEYCKFQKSMNTFISRNKAFGVGGQCYQEFCQRHGEVRKYQAVKCMSESHWTKCETKDSLNVEWFVY